jgi:hypothetical protein
MVLATAVNSLDYRTKTAVQRCTLMKKLGMIVGQLNRVINDVVE